MPFCGPYHKSRSAKIRARIRKGMTNKEIKKELGETSRFIADVRWRLTHPNAKARLQAAYKQRKFERSYGL
jgi:hypothetical protein